MEGEGGGWLLGGETRIVSVWSKFSMDLKADFYLRCKNDVFSMLV